jgi:hypothetical protein
VALPGIWRLVELADDLINGINTGGGCYSGRWEDVLMKLKVQLIVCADDGREAQVQEVATLDKDCQRLEHLGVTLAEAKELLATLQSQEHQRNP